MTIKEKVLKGIEHHTEIGCWVPDDPDDCCPYWNIDNCANQMMKDAAEIIKNEDNSDDRQMLHWEKKKCIERSR